MGGVLVTSKTYNVKEKENLFYPTLSPTCEDNFPADEDLDVLK